MRHPSEILPDLQAQAESAQRSYVLPQAAKDSAKLLAEFAAAVVACLPPPAQPEAPPLGEDGPLLATAGQPAAEA